MDKRLKQDMLIEDALKSQPLVPMPRSISAGVMASVQKVEARRPAPLTWGDFVLSFVIASCIAALWLSLANLPPIVVARLRIQGILLYQDFLVNSHWLVPAIFFGLAAVLAAITIPSLYRMAMDHGR